jgi:hypothetical protein
MSHSYFEGTFRCLAAGHEHRASISTSVESEPGTVFTTGSVFPADTSDMARTHFVVQAPADEKRFRILEAWNCPTCGSPEWVEAVVENGILRSLATVRLDADTFQRVNYVSEAIVEFYENRTGERMYEGDEYRANWREALAAALRESGSP